MRPLDELQCDILILGAGGAGMLAAVHATEADPTTRIVMVVKGLLGQSGCTRMVQGRYNCVLNPADSFERHFEDTVKGGQFLNNQELAWALVSDSPARIIELENAVGCLFDRNPDGTIHQKPFAGQSFDRTVHKGDLTGIEIMSNLRDWVLEQPNITVLEETRGLDLSADATDGFGAAAARHLGGPRSPSAWVCVGPARACASEPGAENGLCVAYRHLLQNVLFGFSVTLAPANLLACFVGVFIGTLVGVLPGIGPVATMSLLFPVTYAMSPTASIIMMAGIYYGAMYGGSTTSILWWPPQQNLWGVSGSGKAPRV